MSFPKDIPELSELKQLELKFRVPADHSILFLSSIIRASPRLLKLILKVNWNLPFQFFKTDCGASYQPVKYAHINTFVRVLQVFISSKRTLSSIFS